MYGYVYKVTNNINNHVYFGKHKSTSTNDNYWGGGVLIRKEIKQFGIENFTKQILAVCDCDYQMRDIEAKYIQQNIENANCINILKGNRKRFKTNSEGVYEEYVQMAIEFPIDLITKMKKEAKEQGVVWSTYAREQILKSLKTKKYTR